MLAKYLDRLNFAAYQKISEDLRHTKYSFDLVHHYRQGLRDLYLGGLVIVRGCVSAQQAIVCRPVLKY